MTKQIITYESLQELQRIHSEFLTILTAKFPNSYNRYRIFLQNQLVKKRMEYEKQVKDPQHPDNQHQLNYN